MEISQHYVTFLSPGTMFAETSRKEIDSWDVEAAKEMARDTKERHGATPYGFYFTTRGRESEDLDSKQTACSSMYYLGGKVRTLAEVEKDNLPSERILRSNMSNNGFGKVIENNNSWKVTLPLKPDDVVLDW